MCYLTGFAHILAPIEAIFAGLFQATVGVNPPGLRVVEIFHALCSGLVQAYISCGDARAKGPFRHSYIDTKSSGLNKL